MTSKAAPSANFTQAHGANAADWIFANGEIVTCDARVPRAEAIAIAGERVVALGSTRKLRHLRGRETRWVELAGATVIPGLVDAHAHMDREGLKFLAPSLADCRSISDIKALIHRLAARSSPGEWITGICSGTAPHCASCSAFHPNELQSTRSPAVARSRNASRGRSGPAAPPRRSAAGARTRCRDRATAA